MTCFIEALGKCKTEKEMEDLATKLFHLSLEISKELEACRNSGGHEWKHYPRYKPTWQCTKCKVVTTNEKRANANT
jgi:hypothetical protein